MVYYAKSASYLTSQLCRYAEYAAALYTALPVINRLEKIHCDTTSDYTNLLVFAGCCKTYFDKKDSTATDMLERAYRLHIDRIRQNASKTAYRDAMAGIINIAYIWNYVKGYEEGLTWTERMGDLVKEYKELYSDDKDYIDKQWARYKIFSATSLEGVGRTEFCSPEVDPEVLIPRGVKESKMATTPALEIGQIYNVMITDSEEFDLYGEIYQQH